MDLSMYISENYYLVVVFLYAIGAMLKKYKKFPDWVIPVALSLLGMITCTVIGYTQTNIINPYDIIQGIICGLTAVGTNQIIKQTTRNITITTSDDSDIDN